MQFYPETLFVAYQTQTWISNVQLPKGPQNLFLMILVLTRKTIRLFLMIEFFAPLLKRLANVPFSYYQKKLSLDELFPENFGWILAGLMRCRHGIKSMSGKCLVSHSCCKAATTVMFSLVTELSTVSSPSINKSMKLSIGWEYGLLEFREVLLFLLKLYEISRNWF